MSRACCENVMPNTPIRAMNAELNNTTMPSDPPDFAPPPRGFAMLAR